MDQTLINRIVEGALLASSQPLTLAQLKDLFPEEEPAPPGSIERALERCCAVLPGLLEGRYPQVMNQLHEANVG